MSKDIPASPPHTSDEPYAGAPNTVVTLGYGSGYGWIYKGIGAVAGLAVALFSTSGSNKWIEAGQSWMQKAHKTLFGKGGITVAGAMVGSFIGHYIGLAIGLKHGAEQAPRGREQFERMKAERDVARGELASLKNEYSSVHDVQTDVAPAADSSVIEPKAGSHAANVQAEQEAAKTAELVR